MKMLPTEALELLLKSVAAADVLVKWIDEDRDEIDLAIAIRGYKDCRNALK